MLTYILSGIIIILLLIILVYIIKKGSNDGGINQGEIRDAIFLKLKETETSLKSEFTTNRSEFGKSAKDLRDEVNNQLSISTKNFSEQITALITSTGDRFNEFRKTNDDNSKEGRKEQKANLDEFKTVLTEALQSFNNKIRENFSDFEKTQKAHFESQNHLLAEVKKTLETSISKLQEGNENKLEEMRKTVDEKLQNTLENRLTKSFELVNKNLESVQRGLGEMQQLAVGVGNLKKVLEGVKPKGILGEIQLGAILEEILAPEQYKANIATKKGSREFVEYAICLPGRDENGSHCYLPVDSKFPLEDYSRLIAAYENGDVGGIDAAKKGVVLSIKKCAKDIKEKYLDPPNTTDFGIMFLPFEGLYAEVVRNTDLLETLQRDLKVIVTGPSTLAALLSSLRLGFRTLAIEKRSGEIKEALCAVKTEFTKFGKVLESAKSKIDKAGEDIEELVGVRTRKIKAKLKSFEEMPVDEATMLLNDTIEQEEIN